MLLLTALRASHSTWKRLTTETLLKEIVVQGEEVAGPPGCMPNSLK